jgi:hypothetical protein
MWESEDSVELLGDLMQQLLRKIDCVDDKLDSFERQYHCGELNQLLQDCWESIGLERPER